MAEATIYYGKTFFPGTRKEVVIESVNLHCDKSEVQKIKLTLSMKLDDGKQVGMPSWVGADYDRLAKVGCEAGTVKYPDIELKEMTLDCYEHDQAEHYEMRLVSPKINAFSMQRGDGNNKDVPQPVWIEFTTYVDFTKAIWGWLPEAFRPARIWVLFNCTQQEIPQTQTDHAQLSLA